MISKNLLISKLPPFLNQQNIIVENQDVDDIITGILKTHEKYKKDYDKISGYFEGKDVNETSQNIFNFLKQNIRYKAESENRQMLKSPSSFISTGTGDCKSFALMINGINDSIRRKNGESYELIYRFASYDPFNNIPQHVFAVVKDKNDEIYVDPVLNYYNQKKEPYYYKDKKIKNMSLIALNGISGGQFNDQDLYDQHSISGHHNNYLKGTKMGDQLPTDIPDPTGGYYTAAATIWNFADSIFGHSNKANPNDWKGWDAQDRQKGIPVGNGAGYWVLNDGDSIPNEASNILSWIQANNINQVIGFNKIANRNVTFNDIINKLRKGGLNQEADILVQSQNTNPIKKLLDAGTNATKTAGISPFIIIALIGAGAYYFTKKKS